MTTFQYNDLKNIMVNSLNLLSEEEFIIGWFDLLLSRHVKCVDKSKDIYQIINL